MGRSLVPALSKQAPYAARQRYGALGEPCGLDPRPSGRIGLASRHQFRRRLVVDAGWAEACQNPDHRTRFGRPAPRRLSAPSAKNVYTRCTIYRSRLAGRATVSRFARSTAPPRRNGDCRARLPQDHQIFPAVPVQSVPIGPCSGSCESRLTPRFSALNTKFALSGIPLPRIVKRP